MNEQIELYTMQSDEGKWYKIIIKRKKFRKGFKVKIKKIKNKK